MDGYLPVRVNVPLEDYRRLNTEASAAGLTVAEHILRSLTPKLTAPPARPGRPSAYTPAVGEEITADRRFGKSWAEIGRCLGIDGHTAKDWHTKYLNEVREQNMRYRAERAS